MKDAILALAEKTSFDKSDRELFHEFRLALEEGAIRSATPDESEPTGWRTESWVKRGILIGFRMGGLTAMPGGFWDKDTYPARDFCLDDGIRLVPGGSSVRTGAYVAPGVVMMPPSYINVGAYVGKGTMVDSHVLVGSCAQIGERVHLSAAVQIGGVLEPVGANPVIIEDDAMIGGNCGVYEGVIVKKRAILGSGVILNKSTPIYNLDTGEIHRDGIVPEGAVVVAGSRPARGENAEEWGINLYTPVIVKIRDANTDDRVRLEDFLR